MAQNKPRYVPTFRAPTEYELEIERARRQKALAEALAQQEYQPIEGGVAPIPRAAPLVKALQGYLTARAGRQAEEAAGRAGQLEEEYARRMAGRMEGGYVPPSKEEAARIYDGGQRTPEQIMAAMPAETTLQEITPTARYRKAPEEALAMASTGLGAAALKDRPVMAARLAKMLEEPKTAEFGTTPQFDASGRAFVVNKAGEVRYLDGVTKPEEKGPTSVQEFEYSKINPEFARFLEGRTPKTTVDVRYGAPVAGVDAQGNPVFFQPNPTGGPPSIISGVAPKPEAMGASEANAALFADRAARAEPVFNQLPPPSLSATAKSGLGAVGNVLLTPENRQFFQAERNFITAVLRKESGANIPESEYNDARRVYIPQAGDDERTLEMKRQARQDAIAGIARGAGPTYKPFGSESGKPAQGGGWTPELEAELQALEEKKKRGR